MNLNNQMNLYLLVYLKRCKLNSENKSPLFLRISLNNQRVEISFKRSIEPELWDSKRQCVKGRTPEAHSINEQIRVFKRKVYDLYTKAIDKNEFISAYYLKEAFLGKNKERKTIVEAFEFHNKKMFAQVGKGYALGTYQRFETCLRLLKGFMKSKYDTENCLLGDVNLSFISEFDFYLRTVRNCNNNTTVKYLKNLKKIINLSRSLDWMKHDPYMNYKVKLVTVDREILTKEELEKLTEKQFSIPRLQQIKDIFLFCCFTGLAYADVKKLSSENIFIGVDGNEWIQINRTKTKVISKIPILPQAHKILDTYKNHPACVKGGNLLPVPSNQKYNAYLKEIADCTEINKNLTSHIARHTFATTVTLNNKIPIESVSRMLGHKSIKTTEHYSKVLDIKISEDMSELMKSTINEEYL